MIRRPLFQLWQDLKYVNFERSAVKYLLASRHLVADNVVYSEDSVTKIDIFTI